MWQKSLNLIKERWKYWKLFGYRYLFGDGLSCPNTIEVGKFQAPSATDPPTPSEPTGACTSNLLDSRRLRKIR
jgi:hypothetical protein